MWKSDNVDSFKVSSMIPERRVELIKAKFLIDTRNLDKLRSLLLDKKGKLRSKAKTGAKEIVEMLLEGSKIEAQKNLARDLILNISNEE